jgi:acyl-CoA-binding protein
VVLPSRAPARRNAGSLLTGCARSQLALYGLFKQANLGDNTTGAAQRQLPVS